MPTNPARLRCQVRALVAFGSLAATGVAPGLAAQRWSLVPEARFAIPSQTAAAASHGTVFAAAPGAVLAYSRTGAAPRRIELGGTPVASRLAVRGDTLVAVIAGAVVLVRTDGTRIRSMPPPTRSSVPGLDPPAAIALLADGSLLAVPRFNLDLVATGGISSVPVQRFAGGILLGTVATQSLRNFGMRVAGPGHHVIATRQPWHDEELVATAPSGDWLAVVDRTVADGPAGVLRVTRLLPSGARVWTRELPYRPAAVPAQAVERQVRSYAQAFFPGGGPAAERAVRQALRVPSSLPTVTAVVAASDGTLWLRREAAVEDAPTVRWTVLGPGGAVAGEVEIPGTWMIVDAPGDRVWAVNRSTTSMAGELLRLRRAAPGR